MGSLTKITEEDEVTKVLGTLDIGRKYRIRKGIGTDGFQVVLERRDGKQYSFVYPLAPNCGMGILNLRPSDISLIYHNGKLVVLDLDQAKQHNGTYYKPSDPECAIKEKLFKESTGEISWVRL